MVASEDLEPLKEAAFNDFTRHAPLEKFYTIDGLLRSHAAEQEQKHLIGYPVNGVSDFEEHTAADIDKYTDQAVQFYIKHGLEPADPTLEKAPVVAILATSSFEIIVTIFALNRLGWAILFLSTRLTPPAYARLLGMADCYNMIVSRCDEATVSEICNDRPGCSGIPLLQRNHYCTQLPAPAFQRRGVDAKLESQKLAFILHSSGSTGFPKPIFLTNLQCLANWRKSFALRAFCTSPLFHSHGLMELFRAFYTRSTMYLGNYAFPITSQNLVEAIGAARPQLIVVVPYVLKLLAEKAEGVQILANAKLVLFGGSSCPDDLGNRLVEHGARLVANYGATETGQIMTSFRPTGDKEWQYMRLHRPVADHTLMDEIAPGVFECVGLDGLPSKGTSNSKPPYSDKNPVNSFRTADLFTRHPDPKKSNYYKYLSRLDDRITLVNGEKVLPIPIESRIKQEELIREAVVFGFERTVPGVLIFRSAEHGLELSDQEFVDRVMPAVEAANASAETFSRIPKDLIVVKGAEVAYPRTDKGTFIRAQVYQRFAEDITRVYLQFEHGECQHSGLQLSITELEEWLLSRFRNDLRVPLQSADYDIFSAGVDSLQTTRIWRMIRKELDLGEGSSSVSQNIVFEKGKVRSLAAYLYGLRTGTRAKDGEGNELQIMQELIERYSSGFAEHVPSLPKMPETEAVVVTGATGNLGAFIVDELVKRPSVGKVYTLVRAASTNEAHTRVMQALETRHIQLPASQLSKIHALPSDLSDPDLGLTKDMLEEILSTATAVIHSAWAVNFNLGVRSFETQHIQGTHNLLNLCLRSHLPAPAKLLFCSSVSTGSNTSKPALISERTIEDLSHAQETGYGRSKLVTEHVVRNAMETTGMHARVLRIGQLSGDTRHAIWNDTEAIALMVRSVLTVGALPALDERPSWLPVDECARAVVDISLSPWEVDRSGDPDLVYHLVNPCTFSWRDDLLPALRHTELPAFEIVSPQEWLHRLASGEQDPVKNPSIKLLDFWKAKYGTSERATVDAGAESIRLVFETTKTLQDCPSLASAKDPMSQRLVERYVNVWLRVWSTT